MDHQEVLDQLSAAADCRNAVELADHLEYLLGRPVDQGDLIMCFKRAVPGIPLRALIDAGAWHRVSGGGMTDAELNDHLSEWLPRKKLEVPARILELIAAGAWVDPGRARWTQVAPWLAGPDDELELLETVAEMKFETSGLHTLTGDDWRTATQDERPEKRGDLDWLDADRALLIAVNKVPGADIAVALDLRARPEDPRVVASEWVEHDHQWREVAPDLSGFLDRLGLATELEEGVQTALLVLGYSTDWLDAGVLTASDAVAQMNEFMTPTDRNQEHYRHRAFDDYVTSKDGFSAAEIGQLLSLTDRGPDGVNLSLDRALMLLRSRRLTREQLVSLEAHELGENEVFERVRARELLLTKLRADGLGDEVFSEVQQSEEGAVHRAALEAKGLRRSHVEWMAASGRTRAVRAIAAQLLESRRFRTPSD